MRNSGNKVLIIVISIIALIAVVGGVFAYLYLCTDMFRSGQELFAKYLTQNINEINQTINLNQINEIEEKLKESKYEENITISYLEAEAENAAAQITIDTQNDPASQKSYGVISLLMDGLEVDELEEPLKLEYMKESNAISLRFTNSIKQFLSVENRDLKQLATNLEISEDIIEQIPDTIDFEQFSLKDIEFTEEEKNAELNKYTNLLYSNIAKEKYTKTKNVVITVNGKTITTNAYALTLNMQDMKTLVTKLLETLKQDEILLAKFQKIDEKLQQYTEESLKESFVQYVEEAIDELNQEEEQDEAADELNQAETTEEKITITIYEQNKKTTRIKLEQNLDSVTLDTTEVEGKKQIDINYTSIDEENAQLSNEIKLIKEDDNKLTLQLNTIDGEERQGITISCKVAQAENNTKIDIVFETEEGQISFNRNIDILTEINYDITLDSSNNIVLNDLSKEQIEFILNTVSGKLTEDYAEPLTVIYTPLLLAMMGNSAMEDADLGNMEAQLFNGKFEEYEGTQISSAEVNSLISVVILHNKQEKEEQTERYVTISGEITLDQETTSAVQVQSGSEYKVECQLDENGLINEIIITKNATEPLN